MTSATLWRRCLAAACVLLAAGCGSASHPTRSIGRGAARRVRVDGYSLTVKCTGSSRGASPTVILLAGMTEPLTTFDLIQRQLSKTIRVCSYDRLGEGSSSKPKTKQSLADSARLLHDLVSAVHLAPHGLVLVGHSLGGQVAAQYASQYRRSRQVRALVLLDATPVGYANAIQKLIPPGTGGLAGEMLFVNTEIASGDNPERLVLSAAPMAPIGNVPVTVVRHGRSIFSAVPKYGRRLEAIWAQGQRLWLRLSPRSRLVVAPHSGHAIYLDQPTLTLQLIRQAISQAG